MQEKTKAAVALAVVSLSILASTFAFTAYYGQVFQPPPILNANMQYWTVDPTKNITTPYLWTIDLIEAPTDNASVFQAVVAGRNAVGLRVIRSNANNSQIWTTIHVRQDLHGQALNTVFKANITLDVFPTFLYLYDPDTKNPQNAFGVEINDGTNLIWFLYADEPSQTVQLPHHRIVLTQTPLNVWSTRTLNISSQYASAGWEKPVSISFTFIIGTTWLHPGNWVGYFSNLAVTFPPLRIQTLSQTQTTTIFSIDVIAIIFLAAIGAVYWKRRSVDEMQGTRRKVKRNGR